MYRIADDWQRFRWFTTTDMVDRVSLCTGAVQVTLSNSLESPSNLSTRSCNNWSSTIYWISSPNDASDLCSIRWLYLSSQPCYSWVFCFTVVKCLRWAFFKCLWIQQRFSSQCDTGNLVDRRRTAVNYVLVRFHPYCNDYYCCWKLNRAVFLYEFCCASRLPLLNILDTAYFSSFILLLISCMMN